jgi:hypothetical protein
MSLVMSTSPSHVSTSTHLEEVTVPGTTACEEALQLQTEMYRQVTRSGSRAIEEIVHFSPQHVTFLALSPLGCDLPMCTVKVVRPPETLIQELVHFAPGSLPADELQAVRIAELGGFVIRPGVERDEIPDLLDALALALLQFTEPTIASFWLLPRRHLLRLFRAEVPQLLLPYRIELCLDVLDWNTSSPLLHALRATNFQGTPFWSARGALHLHGLPAGHRAGSGATDGGGPGKKRAPGLSCALPRGDAQGTTRS